MLEHLESRRLLALPLSGGIVQITAGPYITANNDVIELVVNSGILQLRNSAGAVVDSISMTGVAGINVSTGAGNDFVRMGRADGSLMPGVPITIRGGTGNDTLIGGNNADQLFGDDNDDRLDGRAEGDRMDGGGGFDTADYGYRTRSINVSLTNSSTANDGTNTVDSSTPAFYNDKGRDNLVNMEAVLGGANSDYMVGNTSANWFDGGGGNDTMFGNSGIDTLIGGAGTDLGYGEGDADYFFYQDNLGDQFLGGLGTTYAQYDSILDTPATAATAQTFSSLSVESSTSLLSSSTTTSNGKGGGGGPPSSGEFVDVVLTAEDLQNTDFTYLDKKNANSIPQYLQLRLKALKPDGSLELMGTSGNDVITISQTGSQVTVSVNGELYDFDSSQLTRIVINGLGGDDLITADAGVTVPLVIDAGTGNDTVVGGSGNDALFAGEGDDSVSGGDGSDSIDGGTGNDLLAGDGGADSINAGSGNDSVLGGDGNDSLFGEEGADTLLGGGGDDAMDGGMDNDSMLGGLGNDVMLGGSGVDSIWGQEGDDNIDGQEGDDILVGEAGQDFISGGLGRDILIGGADADNLVGGDGDDLLIPGTTLYDNNVDALNWMALEWTRTDRSYSNRIASLNGGGTGSGNNLTFYLRPGEGSTKTVFDDNAVDTLTGGADLDYFFVSQKDAIDSLTDRESGENITQL